MTGKCRDMVGERFGSLIVLSRSENSENGKRQWLCKCDCGEEKIIIAGSLCSGRTKSCGCLSKTINGNYKHGHSKIKTSITYNSWQHMKQRCLKKHSKDYSYYGGRGITICEKWLNFSGFIEDMGECPEGYSIERIDVNGNYEPSNCKWIPKSYQSRNTRRSVFTEEIVCEIRKDRDAGMTRGELVEKYKATEFNIDSVIYDKKSWQEVGHV